MGPVVTKDKIVDAVEQMTQNEQFVIKGLTLDKIFKKKFLQSVSGFGELPDVITVNTYKISDNPIPDMMMIAVYKNPQLNPIIVVGSEVNRDKLETMFKKLGAETVKKNKVE